MIADTRTSAQDEYLEVDAGGVPVDVGRAERMVTADRWLLGQGIDANHVAFDRGPGHDTLRNLEATPDAEQFARHTEPFRRELLAHCYRMLGSVDDAEDVVQETCIRAWRSYARFEGPSSVRVWLYRIATNASLTALAQRGRRVLPSSLGAPSDDPEAVQVAVDPTSRWLRPIPDALVSPESVDPAVIFAFREGLRLALVASVQTFRRGSARCCCCETCWSFQPLRSRRCSVPRRRRSKARCSAPAPGSSRWPRRLTSSASLTEPIAHALLDRYIAAFESADAAALEHILREDAVLEMTGSRTWFAGLKTCMPFLASHALFSLAATGGWFPPAPMGNPRRWRTCVGAMASTVRTVSRSSR